MSEGTFSLYKKSKRRRYCESCGQNRGKEVEEVEEVEKAEEACEIKCVLLLYFLGFHIFIPYGNVKE